MRMPASLAGLADYGLIDEVLRPLMSGKEAQIFLVMSGGEERVAKVYREAEHRNFKHRAVYTEGRVARNTRDRRAQAKRTRYGRSQDEAAWRSTEVDMIYRLSAAGVRVPRPHHFVDGVLIMELVKGADGGPAPRLGDLKLERDAAAEVYERLLREVVRMLAAGVVHGDLSDFNVLMDSEGPVIIDLPQAVDASANSNARKLLLRDVDNLHKFAKRFVPGVRIRPYAQEMWALYERGELTADTELRGQFQASSRSVDTGDVLGLIRDADRDEERRREAQGLPPVPRPRRVEVEIKPATQTTPTRSRRRRRTGSQGAGKRPPLDAPRSRPKSNLQPSVQGSAKPSATAEPPPAEKPRRRRRRRRSSATGAGG